MRDIEELFWLVMAIVFALLGGYNWFILGQIDRAALYLALAAINHSNYVSAAKQDRNNLG